MPETEPAPSANRLVIRIKLPREGLPAAPARRPVNKGAVLLTFGGVAALLVWIGIKVFGAPESAPLPTAPVATPAPAPAPSEPAPIVSKAPAPAAEPPPVTTPAPKFSTNEVIPDVPRSARETIRGTIRVVIRVIVARDGTVIAATSDIPGPSRYFERLALQASRKWTFAPSDSDEQRVVLVRFSYTRSGTTARASPL